MADGDEKANDALGIMQVGDIWEVEIHKIWPYRRLIEVLPLGLIKREMEE
jgi:hypothetical protein